MKKAIHVAQVKASLKAAKELPTEELSTIMNTPKLSQYGQVAAVQAAAQVLIAEHDARMDFIADTLEGE